MIPFMRAVARSPTLNAMDIENMNPCIWGKLPNTKIQNWLSYNYVLLCKLGLNFMGLGGFSTKI